MNLLSLTLLILFLLNFQSIEQSPIKYLKHLTDLSGPLRIKKKFVIYRPINFKSKQHQKITVNRQEDEAEITEEETNQDTLTIGGIFRTIRHYVRMRKLIRGLNMLLDIQELLQDFGKNYLID